MFVLTQRAKRGYRRKKRHCLMGMEAAIEAEAGRFEHHSPGTPPRADAELRRERCGVSVTTGTVGRQHHPEQREYIWISEWSGCDRTTRTVGATVFSCAASRNKRVVYLRGVILRKGARFECRGRAPGFRDAGNKWRLGELVSVGLDGYCWSSEEYDVGAMDLSFNMSWLAPGVVNLRGHGLQLRCLSE